MIPKSNQRAVQRYVSKHYDRIVLTMPKGERDQIKEAASRAGDSVNGFIMAAVHEKMKGAETVKSLEKPVSLS